MASDFSPTISIEKKYAALLRKVARIVGGIADVHMVGEDVEDVDSLTNSLLSYASTLEPWAEYVAEKTLRSVSISNEKAWKRLSRSIGKSLEREITVSPTASLLSALQKEHVELIKSLPIEAAQKAQEYAKKALYTSERADQVSKKILNLGEMTKNRATLIARTEIARANSLLTQSRAISVGAETYVWETMEDAAVRPSHVKMRGTVHRFDTPPFIDGEGYHGPGEFPNCRCYPRPII